MPSTTKKKKRVTNKKVEKIDKAKSDKSEIHSNGEDAKETEKAIKFFL